MGEGPQPAAQTEPQVQAEPESTAGVEKGIPEAGSPSQQQGATEVVEAPAQVVTQKPPQEQVEPEAPVKVTGEGEQPSAQAVPLDQAEPEPEPEPRVTVVNGQAAAQEVPQSQASPELVPEGPQGGAQPTDQAPPQAQVEPESAQPEPQADTQGQTGAGQSAEQAAGQPSGTELPMASCFNWKWRVRIQRDSMSESAYCVFRFITNAISGQQSRRKIYEHGAPGPLGQNMWTGPFGVFYYLDHDMPKEWIEEFMMHFPENVRAFACGDEGPVARSSYAVGAGQLMRVEPQSQLITLVPPQPGGQVLATEEAALRDWQFIVTVESEVWVDGHGSDQVRKIVHSGTRVEVKTLIGQWMGPTLIAGRIYYGGLGPYVYTNDMPLWLYDEYNRGLQQQRHGVMGPHPEVTVGLRGVPDDCPDKDRYAGVHHRGVEVVCPEPGHLMTVTQEVDAAGVLVTKKCLRNVTTGQELNIILNRQVGGVMTGGRMYLGPVGHGPVGTDFYPAGKEPFQVIECLDLYDRSAAEPENVVEVGVLEADLRAMYPYDPVRIIGLTWIERVMSYPIGRRPEWAPAMPVVQPQGTVHHDGDAGVQQTGGEGQVEPAVEKTSAAVVEEPSVPQAVDRAVDRHSGGPPPAVDRHSGGPPPAVDRSVDRQGSGVQVEAIPSTQVAPEPPTVVP
jgi:hypothetical protein